MRHRRRQHDARASTLRRALRRPRRQSRPPAFGGAATWIGIAAALAVLFAPATAAGAEAAPERADAAKMASMEFRDAALPDLLRDLARGAGLKPVLDPGIEGTATGVFRNVSWHHALAVVCLGHGLKTETQGKTLFVVADARHARRPAGDSPIVVLPRLDGTVLIEVCSADARQVFREIEKVTDSKILADEAIGGAITCSIHGLTLDEAIGALAAGCNATATRKHKAYLLAAKPAAPERKEAIPGPITPEAAAQAVEACDAVVASFREFGDWLEQHPPFGLYKAVPTLATPAAAPARLAAGPVEPPLFFAPPGDTHDAVDEPWGDDPDDNPAGLRQPQPALGEPKGGGLLAALPTTTDDPTPGPAPAAELAVNMEFRDTELATVLRAICQGAGVDFVLDPGVKGQVTAKLKNTSWQKALDIVLKSHGLEARPDGDAVLIGPVRPGTKAPESRVRVTRRDDGLLDLDASGAEIRDALHQVATAAHLSIVTAKDVTGAVTASLQGLSPQDTLAAIADSCEAEVSEQGRIIHVRPRPAGPAKADATARPKGEPAVQVTRRPDGTFDILAREASVRDVLAKLAAAAGLNIVTAESITSITTLGLNGVSAEDALAAITAQAGLVLKPMGGVLIAAPAAAAVQSDVFRLRYAEAAELGKAMKDQLEGAKIAVVAKYNLIVVTGPPEIVAAARMIIEKVEEDPIQVTIETLMVETNLIGDKNIGIEWQDSIGFTATCPKMPYAFPFNIDGSSGLNPGYDPADSRSRGDSSVPFADVDDFEFGFLSSTGLSAVINMLKQDTSTKMVARPTITTMENQQAKINMVTKYPVAQYQVATDTGVLQVSGFEYKEFGTILEVTPRVDGDHVIMTVHPEVSRQAGTTTFNEAELPLIASQETTTQVRIKDGDTLVIAGLVREDSEERDRRVPWLGRLPCIGPLFRNKRSKIDQRRHLLIFITPHIVRDADFAKDAKRKQKQVDAAKTLLSDDGDPKND